MGTPGWLLQLPQYESQRGIGFKIFFLSFPLFPFSCFLAYSFNPHHVLGMAISTRIERWLCESLDFQFMLKREEKYIQTILNNIAFSLIAVSIEAYGCIKSARKTSSRDFCLWAELWAWPGFVLFPKLISRLVELLWKILKLQLHFR